MKKMLAATTGALLLTGIATADFVGLEVEAKDDPDAAALGLFVCNVYAVYDDLADEQLSVGNSNISTTAANGFWQAPANEGGGDTAPAAFVIGLFPNTAFDTFVTIGVKVNDGTDSTSTDPDFGMGADTIVGGWFNGNPVNPNGQYLPDADGRVLLAQLTLQDAASSDSISGSMTVFYKDADTGQAVGADADFFHAVPAPGALALLGLAGLAGRRRRRA